MLAERSVRRLSIRAPDDALVRRAAFLIEDALRTASLPGDGGGLLLLRRLQLPPFSATASAQQVALRLEAQCRETMVVEGMTADDSALAGAPAVRFADALSAHLALTRLILGGHQGRAWCWPLVVKGYRPALGTGSALRALALSLAALPEAPTALPCWLAQLVAKAAGVVTALLAALDAADLKRLQQACSGARLRQAGAGPAQWQAALDLSARLFGREDGRHRWLAGVAKLCGVETGAYGDPLQFDEARERPAPTVDKPAPWRKRADPADLARAPDGEHVTPSPLPAREQPLEVGPYRTPGRPSPTVDKPTPSREGASPADFLRALDGEHAAPSAPESVGNQPLEVGSHRAPGGSQPNESSGNTVSAPTVPIAELAARPRELAARPRAVATARSTATLAETAGDEATADARAGQVDSAFEAATAAGGLLFLVPLLTQLGLPKALADDPAWHDLPQRIFAILLRRLSIVDEDPAWQLCEGGQLLEAGADLDAGRWLAACRGHLRLQLGIGLYSLVCRPAMMRITATHADVRLPIEAVDVRIRRAGLDIDPGWVAWLGRVLRFHYGPDSS